MEKIVSDAGTYLLGLDWTDENFLTSPNQFPEYTILFIPEGEGTFYVDHGSYRFTGPVLLFSSPLQVLRITQSKPVKCAMLQFHGDFYCIEFHRAEVACNGLLFNNIYLAPTVSLSEKEATLFRYLIDQIQEEITKPVKSDMVLKACLQYYLAKASHIKLTNNGQEIEQGNRDDLMEQFIQILDKNYLTLHKPGDYARLLAMSTNNLTKRSRRYFSKTPSQLIQDRLIQEAKKYLYLTNKSIKEIAFILKFKDESYFSRVFKKVTKVGPQAFRNKTGVSIVADLYQ